MAALKGGIMESIVECCSLEKEQLLPLRDALNDLMCFLQRWNNGFSHSYRYLQYMRDNIEICMYTQDDWGDGLAYLEVILQQNWNEANDGHMGMDSCEWPGEGRRELFLQYLGLWEEVGQYFYA